MFILTKHPPAAKQQMLAFRLVGVKEPTEKAAILRMGAQQGYASVRSVLPQRLILNIPEAPVVHWLSKELISLLASGRRVRDLADVHDGMTTGDNKRFLRFSWEVSSETDRWAK